ncbi:unnamed protein product [Penicillium olsonii]|uniref:Uncharacterized protein n=1 Tax=Penicillium olsonii TaxID=99116 RepID=A0A9W4ILX5_PENOL|nr:unnamed protein product [Penicillium olsonii]CAG8300393.1 unnamed protein product [Penicillium olsonii]
MATFPPWQSTGQQIRKWIQSANEPGCTVSRITLTLDTLPPHRTDWDINSEAEHLDPEHYKWLEHVGIPTTADRLSRTSAYWGTIVMKSEGALTSWTGMTGPSVIFINKVERARNSNDPYMSELTHAVYTKDFKIEGLKHIWVTDIQNDDTALFVNKHVYAPGTELQYPRDAVITWDPSYPHFDALLGTPMGKIVGYFILGAFGQGMRRISHISVFRSFGAPQLRFDIAPV